MNIHKLNTKKINRTDDIFSNSDAISVFMTKETAIDLIKILLNLIIDSEDNDVCFSLFGELSTESVFEEEEK